jgi:hypothetical protein
MDLSGFIVIILGILFFFGGAAWLEIRSRKNKRPVRQGGHSPQPAVSTMSVRDTAVHRRKAKSESYGERLRQL